MSFSSSIIFKNSKGKKIWKTENDSMKHFDKFKKKLKTVLNNMCQDLVVEWTRLPFLPIGSKTRCCIEHATSHRSCTDDGCKTCTFCEAPLVAQGPGCKDQEDKDAN